MRNMASPTGIYGRLPCRYPIVVFFSQDNRKDPGENLLPMVTGKGTRRSLRGSHPWVSPKMSLVDPHPPLCRTAGMHDTDWRYRVDPGAWSMLYTRG